MIWFSSWGPTNDGRLKPDVVAPGCEDTLNRNDNDPTRTIWSTIPTDDYGGMCGTSMATPAVSGSVALLIQDYKNTHNNNNPLPSTIKAILTHTAKDLGNIGPDYSYGYGRIDVLKAVDLIESDTETNKVIKEDVISSQGETDDFDITVSEGQSELRVTLAWDDYPATANADPALVNNLDLVLIAPDETEYYPWVLDPNSPSSSATTGIDNLNPIEQVYVQNPQAGIWIVRVKGTTVPNPPQNYSLVSSNSLYRLEVSIDEPADGAFSNTNETFLMNGTVECTIGDCGDVSAYAQFCSGADCTNFADITSTSSLSTSDPNPYDCGHLGGYTTPTSVPGTIAYDTATKYDSSVPEYTKTDSPSSALIGGTEDGTVSEFQDSFEDQVEWAHWTETGEGDWVIETPSVLTTYNGSYVAHSDDCDTGCQLTSEVIDLSGETDVTLTFYWAVKGLDSGEYLALDIYDGTWHEDVRSITGTTEETVTIDLDANYNMSNDFKIRFDTLESTPSEFAEFDAVSITSITPIESYRYYTNINLPSIPSGAIMDSANLNLYVTTTESRAIGEVYHADEYDAGISAQTIHQDGAPEYCQETNPIATFDASTIGAKTLDVNTALQEAYDNNKSYVAFQIREEGENQKFQVDGSAGANPPSLDITYKMPNPTTCHPEWNVISSSAGVYELRIHAFATVGTVDSSSNAIHFYPDSGASAYRMDWDGDNKMIIL